MKRNNIKKDDILNNIKLSNRLPISFSDKIFDNLFEIFKIGLLKDGILKISGLGTFKVLNKKERIGLNPKTKIKYTISKRKVVVFYPSKLVKNKLNGKE
jgi:nucleoid DNA-binding protein|tara:strand:- start:157 stop:453 length:297 start_codon:yes stop_codon:yes gene_type:complete